MIAKICEQLPIGRMIERGVTTGAELIQLEVSDRLLPLSLLLLLLLITHEYPQMMAILITR